MEERTNAGILWMFIVLPIPAGMAILIALVVNVAAHGRTFTKIDWFAQVVWFGLLGLGLMTALPAAGWQELQRRRCQRETREKEQARGVKKPASDGLDEML